MLLMPQKNLAVFLTLLLPMFAFAVTYNPDQLTQFKTTGQCPGCNLTDASINGSYIQANLQQAALTEASFSGKLQKTNFIGANMVNTIFAVQDGQEDDFSEANMTSISMKGDFSGSSFKNAILSGSNLASSNFSYADFSGANLSGVNLNYSDLIHATVTTEQLASVASLDCTIMPDGTKHPSASGVKC